MLAAGIHPYLPFLTVSALIIMAVFMIYYGVNLWGYFASIAVVAFFSNFFAYRQHQSEKEERKYIHTIEKNELKLRQQKLELERANEDLESFNHTISHDLKGYIRTANGFSHMLKRSIQRQDEAGIEESLGFIQSSMKQMQILLEELMRLAKINQTDLQLSRINLSEMCEEIWRDLKVQYNDLDIVLECRKSLQVTADEGLVKQVMTNLLSNAFKYSQGVSCPKVKVGGRIEENATIIYIKDNGVGFNMSQYERLFKLFKRLHGNDEFEGTGVGLAIVKKIINKHGGQIWAESEVGQGATFYFSLPHTPF